MPVEFIQVQDFYLKQLAESGGESRFTCAAGPYYQYPLHDSRMIASIFGMPSAID
jgi:hypothetical protein